MKLVLVSAAIALAIAASGSAQAAVTLKFSGTSDAALEGAGGYLNGTLGLPMLGNSAKTPIERAVGEVRIGSTSDARRVGFHTPNAATGLPAPAGAGVTKSLTSVNPIGSSNAAWSNGQTALFSIKRIGTTITYQVGANSWSDTAAYFADINAFVLRIRSNGVSPRDVNAIGIDQLQFQDAVTAGQSLADLSTANGAVALRLYDGVSGDFTLSGRYAFSWSGTAPTGSQLASQIKLIQLPAVPEPATWAMMIAGFGLAGVAMRRREGRRALA